MSSCCPAAAAVASISSFQDPSLLPVNPNLTGTFHRRVLPAPAIAFRFSNLFSPQRADNPLHLLPYNTTFSSEMGQVLFKEALAAGGLAGYFPLAEAFQTQGHPSFCGLGSLTMALNALLLDPGRVWSGVWRWFDEGMLDCCSPIEAIKAKGITLPKLDCLARCQGANCIMKVSWPSCVAIRILHTSLIQLYHRMQLGDEITESQFRDDVIRACTTPSVCIPAADTSSTAASLAGSAPTTTALSSAIVMVVSYSRKVPATSHSGHSPVCPYEPLSMVRGEGVRGVVVVGTEGRNPTPPVSQG